MTLALLLIIFGGFFLVLGLPALAALVTSESVPGVNPFGIVVFSSLGLLVVVGLWRMEPWAYVIALGYASYELGTMVLVDGLSNSNLVAFACFAVLWVMLVAPRTRDDVSIAAQKQKPSPTAHGHTRVLGFDQWLALASFAASLIGILLSVFQREIRVNFLGLPPS